MEYYEAIGNGVVNMLTWKNVYIIVTGREKSGYNTINVWKSLERHKQKCLYSLSLGGDNIKLPLTFLLIPIFSSLSTGGIKINS